MRPCANKQLRRCLVDRSGPQTTTGAVAFAEEGSGQDRFAFSPRDARPRIIALVGTPTAGGYQNVVRFLSAD